MALISCPECGKEISNKSQTCIYCGCPIHGVHNVTQIKETSKINKRVWVAALVFICVAALVVLTIGISANTLNGEEKHVLKLVEEYQSMGFCCLLKVLVVICPSSAAILYIDDFIIVLMTHFVQKGTDSVFYRPV